MPASAVPIFAAAWRLQFAAAGTCWVERRSSRRRRGQTQGPTDHRRGRVPGRRSAVCRRMIETRTSTPSDDSSVARTSTAERWNSSTNSPQHHRSLFHAAFPSRLYTLKLHWFHLSYSLLSTALARGRVGNTIASVRMSVRFHSFERTKLGP